MEFSLPEAQTLRELLGEENLSGTVRVNRTNKPGALEYTVKVSTTTPTQAAEQLREVLPEKFSQFLESYEAQLAEQRASLNRSLRWLQEDLAAWRRAVESAGFSPAEAGLAEFAADFRRKQAALRVLDQLDSPEENLTVAPEALSEQELAGPNRTRNTLLAGAVTFLLTLFGTAFWEIL